MKEVQNVEDMRALVLEIAETISEKFSKHYPVEDIAEALILHAGEFVRDVLFHIHNHKCALSTEVMKIVKEEYELTGWTYLMLPEKDNDGQKAHTQVPTGKTS